MKKTRHAVAKLVLVLYALPAFSQTKQFEGLDGCFLLYDLKKSKQLVRFGENRCAERVPPCSTFKVPLALISLDKGVLKDTDDSIKWDGTKREIPAWNRDHTAATWMRDSVVWYSQALTPKLGKQTIENSLKDYAYGNHDMSGGLDAAWLMTTPAKSTLKISADEQMKFFARLYKNELPASARALALTKKLIYLEKSGTGFELSGKTGSGVSKLAAGGQERIGWFIAHLKKDAQEMIAVTAFTDTRKDPPYKYGGPHAKEIAKFILIEKGLWSSSP